MTKRPSRIAFLSVVSNFVVFWLKLIAGIMTGSVAIISEAIHSIMDFVASLIAFISVKISGKPADRGHPYGHKKVENVAGTIETLLIFVAGVWIIIECIDKFIHPEPLKMPMLGVAVMVIGGVINAIVAKLVGKVAKETKSLAMKSNAFHLWTDVYTNIGVAVALIIAYITEWHWIDPLIGLGLAMYIMFEASKLLKESFPPLLDASLSEDEEQKISDIITIFKEEYIEFHDLRTRQSGSTKFIDFHLIVASKETIEKVHELCDRIEARIKEHCPEAEVFIHVEPETEVKSETE